MTKINRMNTINKECRRWLFGRLSCSMSGPQQQPMWCVPLLVWVKIAGKPGLELSGEVGGLNPPVHVYRCSFL